MKPFAAHIIAVLVICSGAIAQDAPLYKQSDAPIDKRVTDLLERMNIKEKVAQLRGYQRQGGARGANDAMFSPDTYRTLIPDGVGSIGPTDLSLEDAVRYRNAVQKHLREQTRLGIPAMFHGEACHGLMEQSATSFPNPLGFACSWDPQLIEKAYDAAGREMRSRGNQHALAPIVDVSRDPRWGRIEETMGEDPYLNGVLGAAMVKGLQGSSDGTVDRDHVMSTLKHFTAHGTPEGGSNRSPGVGGPRELREVHIAPFAYVIREAHPAAIMPSYNEIDGVPSHANHWLLHDVLREELGFKGLIVSDYTAVQYLESVHHIAANATDAARIAFLAGVQLELPRPYAYPSLEQCVADGSVTMQQIDNAVSAILTWKFQLGLFEDPFVDLDKAKAAIQAPEHQALALKAAEESIVLLKNDSETLPISLDKVKKIAVIGPNASVVRLGGYSGVPVHSESILDGIRARVADKAQVSYEQGCVLVKNEAATAHARWQADRVELATDEENRPLIDRAKQAAADADLTILVIGETESLCRESWGRTHLGDVASLDLQGSQPLLVDAVLSAGKPVVAILINGRPLAIDTLKTRAAAIIEGFYGGQEGGTAMAEVLFGDISPSGKLTTTFPRSVGHLPDFYNQKPGADLFNYEFTTNTPVYPFGFGLSYSTFKYADVQIKDSTIKPDGQTTASVEVTNTGSRDADEIVQLYVHQNVSSVTRPNKQLKGFKRVHLKTGETKTIEFPIDFDALAIWDLEMKHRVEPGTFRLTMGPSSAAGENVTLTVSRRSD